jgi:hypothetical protein
LLVQGRLPLPEEENDINPRQDHQQKDDALHEDKPVKTVSHQIGPVFFRELAKLPVPSYKPVYPEDNYEYPDQLDADKGENGMEYFLDEFHGRYRGITHLAYFYSTITQKTSFFQ